MSKHKCELIHHSCMGPWKFCVGFPYLRSGMTKYGSDMGGFQNPVKSDGSFDVVFGRARVGCRGDSRAHWARGNREWCSLCGGDEKETRPAIRLFAASLCGHTRLELVLRCIPSARSEPRVLPCLDIPSKIGGRRGSTRMRSNNRFHSLCRVPRAQGGTRRGIPGRNPRQILRQRSKRLDTCRLVPGRLLSEIGIASSLWPSINKARVGPPLRGLPG